MRILGAGDIHGDLDVAKRLADRAKKEKVDLVILCGDLADDDTIENVLKPFKDNHQKILLIPGNHESVATADFLAHINKAKNIHGYSVKYEDIGIFGCGLANIGMTGLSEEEIFSTLQKGHDHISYLKKKIMVTHVHPTYTLMEKMSMFVPGSKGVFKAVKEFNPDILLCSHVHEAEGLEEQIGSTRVLNVGKEGKIIDL